MHWGQPLVLNEVQIKQIHIQSWAVQEALEILWPLVLQPFFWSPISTQGSLRHARVLTSQPSFLCVSTQSDICQEIDMKLVTWFTRSTSICWTKSAGLFRKTCIKCNAKIPQSIALSCWGTCQHCHQLFQCTNRKTYRYKEWIKSGFVKILVKPHLSLVI